METAASSTNQFGLDLYRKIATGDGNLCLSPYSIESALAMTFAGADGATRTEMARVLHLPANGDEIHTSFAVLEKSLEAMAEETKKDTARWKKSEKPGDPITLTIANRLFAEKGYNFRESFLTLAKNSYNAPLEPVDFSKNPEQARAHINDWVAEQTRKRIQDLIPAGALDETTRMVLTNALYLKAPWADPFEKEATKPEPFHIKGAATSDVPMMHKRLEGVGYVKGSNYYGNCHPVFRQAIELRRFSAGPGRWRGRARRTLDARNAFGMHKTSANRHRPVFAEVQNGTADDAFERSSRSAGDEDGVRRTAGQRELRSSGAAPA